MKKVLLLSILFIYLLSANNFAQLVEKSNPVSFESKNVIAKVPVVTLPAFDMEAMLNEDQKNIDQKALIPFRFAKEF